MNRRTFLNSAVGVGTLAGMCSGVKGAAPRLELAAAAAEENLLAWGVNAIILKSPWNGSPSLDDLLADQEHTIVWNRFYRVGGDNRPVAPTECRVSYNSDTLLWFFRCDENDMSFPTDLQKADWHSLPGLPSGSDSWPPFPDEVDLLIQPEVANQSYYQFAVTPDGLKFGCERLLSSHPDKAADQGAKRGRYAAAFCMSFLGMGKSIHPDEDASIAGVPVSSSG